MLVKCHCSLVLVLVLVLVVLRTLFSLTCRNSCQTLHSDLHSTLTHCTPIYTLLYTLHCKQLIPSNDFRIPHQTCSRIAVIISPHECPYSLPDSVSASFEVAGVVGSTSNEGLPALALAVSAD